MDTQTQTEKDLPTEVQKGKGESPSIDFIEKKETPSATEPEEETDFMDYLFGSDEPKEKRHTKGSKRVPVSVSFSPTLIERIIEKADGEEISRSEVVNRAVESYLNKLTPEEKKAESEERIQIFRKAVKDALVEVEAERNSKAETEKKDRKKSEESELLFDF